MIAHVLRMGDLIGQAIAKGRFFLPSRNLFVPGREFLLNGPRGDHLVHIQVDIPTELTPRQRELIEELARASGEDAGAQAPKKRLIDRVRSLLDE